MTLTARLVRSQAPARPSATAARRARWALVLLGPALLAACGKSGGSFTPPDEPPPTVDLPEFAYATRALAARLGDPLTPAVPSQTGDGSLDAWVLSGSLPTGLVFDDQTGTFSGTPTALAAPRIVRVTATNNDGEYTQDLVVSVGGELRFAYSANAGDNTLNELQANGALQTLEHDGYVVQSAGEAAPQDVQADPLGRLVYSLNSFGLTPYLVDADSGDLTAGTPISLGSGPHALYVHPSGDWLYVSSAGSDRVRAYQVDAVNGTLTLLEQETTAAGPTDLAGDASGRFLIVAHASSEELRSFLIDPATGALTPGDTLALPTVVTPDVALCPLGERLYVVLQQPFAGVLRVDVEPETGAMSLGPTATAGSTPVRVVVEPGRRFAYVLNQGSATISYYSIADATGTLTSLGTLPSTASTVDLRFTRDGRRAFAVDSTGRTARLYEREDDGRLTQTGALYLRQGPRALALVEGAAAPVKRLASLYALNETSQDVVTLSVDPTLGTVSDSGLTPAPTGVGPRDLALDPRGRFAWVSNETEETITIYTLQPDGSLVVAGTRTGLNGTLPGPLTVDTTGRFLYVSLATFNLLGMFAIEPDGMLTVIGTRPLELVPEAIVADPSGLYLYAVNGGNGVSEFGSFRAFRIDPTTGVLTKVDPLVVGTGHPTSLVLTADGRRAYSTQRDLDLAVAWDVSADGQLHAVGAGSSAMAEPVSVALTPDERFAFVTSFDATALGSLLLYDVDPATGRLYNQATGTTTWRAATPAGLQPLAVEIDREGGYVYVLSQTSEDVRVFALDPDTALLTEVQALQRGMKPIRLRRRDALQ
ncbi:MAG: beta-propeller fold lactonase family protein [Planctomycetes bacterium]|nr:beta-propeller fold lactonase family protein [Planctomycetota bacterium]